MTAVLLTGLFLFAGGAAAITLLRGWRTLAAVAPALRRELARCGDFREVEIRTTEVRVTASAAILRPAFSRAARRPAAIALPAAA